MFASRLQPARSALRVQVRYVSNRTELSSPPRSKSFLESVFCSSKMPQVPLDQAFPDLPELKSVAPQKFPTETTQLKNGLRVVTVDSTSPIASVGVFVDAGSRYENDTNRGTSHFLEHFAFKSTENRSNFLLVRDMQKIGANLLCSTSRDTTVYAADVLREHVGDVVHTLADVILHPKFDFEELHDGIPVYREMVKETLEMPDVQVMEAVHAAGYYQNTLGLPLYAAPNANFTKEGLSSYMQQLYTPERMVISGVGMEHSELVKMVEREFGELVAEEADTATTARVAGKAQYTGGDVRLHEGSQPLAHVALAFETASWHSEDLVPMCVLQTMMGGGGSFSAGGPGKGMHSRLYTNVLNRHHWVESANTFNSLFTDSSLFGMYGTCSPQSAPVLVDVLSKELHRMYGPVDGTELQRAKNLLKSSVLMQLENRGAFLEDIGRQMLTYGTVMDSAELCAKIDQVGAEDIKRVATSMLKTPVAVAVCGNTDYTPRYDDIASRFG